MNNILSLTILFLLAHSINCVHATSFTNIKDCSKWFTTKGPTTTNKDMRLDSIISTSDTMLSPELAKEMMLPRGSAIITSAGALEEQGIRQIIHAATGSMNHIHGIYNPTLKSVANAIKNSMLLAKKNGHKRIAVPFLGGRIFLKRIGTSDLELAKRIVKTSIESANGLEVRFIAFSSEDTKLFANILSELYGNMNQNQVNVLHGSIIDFELHGASVIINAANMEVKFGQGLSGKIASATADAKNIDIEAQKLIFEFYSNFNTK